MHPVVFSRAWFDQHQRLLVTLLAWPLVGRVLRKVLAIRSCDVGWKGYIVALMPHAYTVDNGDGTLTTDFRTHKKYAKRLYYVLYPLWQMAHWWDVCVANPLAPALNLGFDTLTAFPDADPETTTVDGMVNRGEQDETFAAIRAGAGTGGGSAETSSWLGLIQFSATTNQFKYIDRSIFLFYTAVLTGAATISAATLSIAGKETSGNINNCSTIPDLDVYTSNPASNTNLVAADYSAFGSTSQTGGAVVTYTGWNANAYNAFVFNATGLSNIAKTGVSKFGVRNANFDVANVAPSPWINDYAFRIEAAYADETGSANDPKLVVTYTVDHTSRGRITQRPRPFAPGIAR